MASSGIVIEDKSSSSALNHLDLVDVPLGVRVPDCRSILKLWTDKTSISLRADYIMTYYIVCAQARLIYALDLTAALHSPKILLSKPRVLFALLHMMLQCLFKLWFIVMPMQVFGRRYSANCLIIHHITICFRDTFICNF